MKKQIKTEKELSKSEISSLPDAEFEALVIRMLREIIECSHKIKEEVKAIQSEIKENIQGTNSQENEAKTQINNSLEQMEEINIQPEQNEEIRIQKIEERLRDLGDNFKRSNILP